MPRARSLGGQRNECGEEPPDIGLVVLELVVLSVGAREVAHLGIVGVQEVEAGIAPNGDDGIESFVVFLLRADELDEIGHLSDGLHPLGRLSLEFDALVLDEVDLRNPVLDIADANIGSFLDACQRSGFLLQAVALWDREIEA